MTGSRRFLVEVLVWNLGRQAIASRSDGARTSHLRVMFQCRITAEIIIPSNVGPFCEDGLWLVENVACTVSDPILLVVHRHWINIRLND